MSWLDNNMHIAVRKNVEASRKFLPPRETISPPVLEVLDHLHKTESKMASQVLIRYAANLHELAMLNDPETIERKKQARKAIPELYKNKRPRTAERLQDQQVPLLELINAFQLQPERKIVDHLFEQAQSFSGNVIIDAKSSRI